MSTAPDPTPLRVNLIAWNNGVGLSRDLKLMADALREAGHVVQVTGIGRGKLRKWFRPTLIRLQQLLRRIAGRGPKYDLNLMLEHIRPEDTGSARLNVFVPNPEWCTPKDMAAVPQMDAIWVKTRHAESLFAGVGVPVRFIGFTSDDRCDTSIPRERRFFHLAGRSSNKGTRALMTLWQAHPEWPRLTVLQNPRSATPVSHTANIEHRIDYVDDSELKTLQNACRFHLCPSETEGFGHYIVEALSVGAVTITTDAAPMNELVNADRGLCVAARAEGRQGLATIHVFDAGAMAAAVETVLSMTPEALDEKGAAALAWYVENHESFPARVAAAVRELPRAG